MAQHLAPEASARATQARFLFTLARLLPFGSVTGASVLCFFFLNVFLKAIFRLRKFLSRIPKREGKSAFIKTF